MQKISGIFKKRYFLGQALDFLPTSKPGLYISSLNIMNSPLQTLQNINKYGCQPKIIPIKTENKISSSEVKGQDPDYRQVDRQ